MDIIYNNLVIILISSIVFSLLSSIGDTFFIRNIDYQIANKQKIKPTWCNFWFYNLRKWSPTSYVFWYYFLFALPIFIPMGLIFYYNSNYTFVNKFYKNNLYFLINIVFTICIWLFAYGYFIDLIFGKIPPIEENKDKYINYID